MPEQDLSYLAADVAALAGRLDQVIAELADILARKAKITNTIFAALGDADFDECERAAGQTGIRRLVGGCLDVHALMRDWCITDRIPRHYLDDSPPPAPLRLVE
jgi:hypothetical protein